MITDLPAENSRLRRRLPASPVTYGNARNIAKVAAARQLLTLVFYGLRDGQIRALSGQPAFTAAKPAA